MKKNILLVSGHLSLLFGITGIFVPVLPTTPFLLISAACYMKGSGRMYNWLVNHKVLGTFIKQYFEYRAVSQRTKLISIAFLWTGISISIIFFIESALVRIIVSAVAVGVTIHIAKIRNLDKKD